MQYHCAYSKGLKHGHIPAFLRISYIGDSMSFMILTRKKLTIFFSCVLIGVIALAVAIILVNPRLKTWAKLEKVVDEDGASSLKRPKPFVLAFSEWIVIFLGVLSYILTALCNYLIIGY